MKFFVTGASGLVGSNVTRVAARRGHEVIAVVHTWSGDVPGAHQVVALDLTDENQVQRAVLDLFPDVIVNCAAISEPAACDAQPQLAQRMNVDLPAGVARLAHHLHARLIHLSTEQVFDGRHAPYHVSDPVAPINLYGRQKAESEQLVARFAPETSVTVRLPLLGGNSLTGQRSLHERLFAAWAAGKTTRLYRDEIRQPCSAENAAEALVELSERQDFRGIVHWAGAAPLSRLEMGRRIAAYFKLPPTVTRLIEDSTQAEAPDGARRQPNLAFDLAPLAGVLKTRPESFDEMLEKLVIPPPARTWFHRLSHPDHAS